MGLCDVKATVPNEYAKSGKAFGGAEQSLDALTESGFELPSESDIEVDLLAEEERNEQMEKLRSAIASLSERQRFILQEVYFHNQTQEKVAIQLQISQQAVSRTLKKAIANLKKYFGSKEVLCGIDLSVPEHSIFGFIGKNGAGKTTTMKAILGLLKADSGEIYVMGEKVHFGQTNTNRHIGYLPDVPEFYSYMTPMEYLSLCGEVCGMDKTDIVTRSKELLELVGLGKEYHRIKGFSRGMKQRLGIAQALLNRPKLLICDEPTSALDPAGRKEILDILLAAKEQTTVLFSTHILSDVERICTEVAFLHDGKIAMQGTIAELRNKRVSDGFIIEIEQKGVADALINVFGDFQYTEKNSLVFHGSEDRFFDIMKYIAENRIPIQRIERIEPTLESLFLEVTK